jgi:hypothetical protein
MTEHLVETCPDDPAMLKLRLDEIAAGGAEIISVLWQTNRVESDQAAAYEARGSFLIVARSTGEGLLRHRRPADEIVTEAPTI